MDHKTNSSEKMDPPEISRSQLPNTSISGSPFLNNRALKLRKKKTQSKLTFLKNPHTKKTKNNVSESVSNCDELKSEEDSEEACTSSLKDPTSCDNEFSENICSNKDDAAQVCPVCWKMFEKGDKIFHMKSCATKHNLTLKQLLDAVDLQTKQIKERKTLGLPCVPTSSTSKKVLSRKNSSASNKIDPDLQLGLALSVSMSENEERQHLMEQEMMLEAGLGDEVAANQASLLEKFGFTSTRPIVPSTHMQIRSGKHKFKTTPLLLSRTQEERERLITEKVAIILSSEGGNTLQSSLLELEVTDNLKSDVLLQLQNKECALWKQASLSLDSNHNSYYVEHLSNTISPTRITLGSKLKHLSQVPCRLKSPENASPMAFQSSMYNEFSSNRDNVLPSVNNHNEDETDITNANYEFSLKLSNDWKNLLNNKMKSDVLIYVKDGQKIFAHELVLIVRCSNVLKDLREKYTIKYINWNEISFNSALAFLDYIYSGSLSRINELDNGADEISFLSKKYSVQGLSCYLKCCMDISFKENHSVSCDISKDRTRHVHDLLNLQNQTIMKVGNCMTQSCKEVELEEEREKLNISSSNSGTSNIRISPECVYTTVSSSSHCKYSLSPDPFDDISDSEMSVIPHDKTSCTSRSQQNLENLLDVLGNNKGSTDCVNSDLKNEFHEEKIISSDDSSLSNIWQSEKRNSSSIENTPQKMYLSVQESESEHMGNVIKCNAKISESEEELDCEEVMILEEINKTPNHIPSNRKKRRNSDSSDSSCSKHICDNARNAVRKSLLRKFACNEENENLVPIEDLIELNEFNKALETSSEKSFNDADSPRALKNTTGWTSSDSGRESSQNSPISINLKEPIRIQYPELENDFFYYNNFEDVCSPMDESMEGMFHADVAKIQSEELIPVVKSVENKYKSPFSSPLSVKSLPILDSSYLLTKTGSSTKKLTLPRTRSQSPSEISVKSDESSPDSILVKCLSETSIHLKTSHDDINEQKEIVLSIDNTESNFVNENSTLKALQNPNTPTNVLKTPNRSLNSVKRLLEDSFSIELEKNFLERKGDCFEVLPCSTPIAAVSESSRLNKQLENVKADENCVTPMADYSGMDTPMLKRELQKYGLKPLKRKRAKHMLRHIYNELHPLVPAHENDDKLDSKSSQCSIEPGTSSRKLSPVKSPSTKPCKKGNNHAKQDGNCERNLSKEVETSGNELSFPSSQESSSSLCEFEYPEDSSDEADTSQTNESELRSAVKKYITRDPKIYQQVLMYEPIWLEHLQDALKADNCKFKLNHLLEILDEECITYRSTQGIKSRQRKNKNKGKAA